MEDGEARISIGGGLAHFPGLTKEQTVSFDQLGESDRQELTRLADEAEFFTCAPASLPRPDARSYTITLTIGGRSRELQVAEPIENPALARLVSKVRRLCTR